MTRREVSAGWAEARAKVNLGLAVTGRRPDGFHTLDSVFVRLALHDRLQVRRAADPGGPDELEVIGDTRVPAADDLVLRAAASLRETAARSLPALRFRLEKAIPVAAGLGGGSADAAAALRLAAGAWGLDLDADPYRPVAARLGADVPFCLSRVGAARIGGIGEFVSPLSTPAPPAGVLLVTLPAGLSTAAVFAELDRRRGPRAGSDVDREASAAVATLAMALADGSDGTTLASLASALRDANDLWPAASSLLPSLVPLRDALEVALDRPCLLTGSGPTLVSLYPSSQGASLAAAGLAAANLHEARDARIIATSTSAPGETP